MPPDVAEQRNPPAAELAARPLGTGVSATTRHATKWITPIAASISGGARRATSAQRDRRGTVTLS